MADYTDIDKLREQAELEYPGDNQSERRELLNALPALLAELVGLRTEVDQLRTDNERLSAENDQLHEACRLLGAVNVAESQDVYAGWSAKLAAAGAERDALQARIDALEAEREADGA